MSAAPVRQVESRSSTPALRTSRVDGVLVIAPQGIFDDESYAAVGDVLGAEEPAPTVIDLSDCTVADPDLLRALDTDRWDRRPACMCVVCGRLSGRRLIALAGVPERLAVFQRTEDALQARAFAEAGYGDGWSPRCGLPGSTPDRPAGHD